MKRLKTFAGIALTLALLGSAHTAQAEGQSLYRCWTTAQLGIDTSPAASLQQAIALYAAWAEVPLSTVKCRKVSHY